ncbi:MAG: acyl-ACP--UDP-N-acetylglucosamine O-acyltransferase [Bacteroidota bacterium]
METSISPLAHVHPDAEIGEGCIIAPFAVIDGDVKLGKNCRIDSHVIIRDGARLGDDCQVFAGAIIATIPQDLKFSGEYSTVEIGNRVTIREYCTINRGTTYSNTTYIEDDVLLMAYVHIAHDCIIRRRAILANTVSLAGHIEIGEQSVIGGHVAIHQFCRVGKHVMISGGSFVNKDIPPYTMVARTPAQYAGVNHRGLKRRSFSDEQVAELQQIYRIIYRSGRNITQALAYIDSELPQSPLRDEVLAFVRNSPRGICRGYRYMERNG